MSSSPPDRLQLPGRPDLLTLFRSVPDPCDPRGGRHPLGVILADGIDDPAFPRLDANVLDRCSGCSCGPARAWSPAGG